MKEMFKEQIPSLPSINPTSGLEANTYWPGFLNDNRICCYKRPGRNVYKNLSNLVAENSLDDKSNDYIQGYSKILSKDRLGFVHPILIQFLQKLSPGVCQHPRLVDKGNNHCFFRMGLRQSHNSFFTLMAIFTVNTLTLAMVKHFLLPVPPKMKALLSMTS